MLAFEGASGIDATSQAIVKGLRAAMAAEMAQKNGAPQIEAAPEQKAQPDLAKLNAEGEAKAQEQADGKTQAKEGPWSKLGKPPEKKVEGKTEEYGDTPPEGDKAQTAWTGIKRKVKEYETQANSGHARRRNTRPS